MSDLCESGHGRAKHEPPKFGWCDACPCAAFDLADCDDLAAILAKHRWIDKPFFWTGCSCDPLWWKGYESAGKTEDMYFAHVAQMVLESDWLRDVKADVWDECCKGFAWALDNGPDDMAIQYVKDHNQYRADRADNTTNRT